VISSGKISAHSLVSSGGGVVVLDRVYRSGGGWEETLAEYCRFSLVLGYKAVRSISHGWKDVSASALSYL
jgi:hypothetical protein